MVQAQMQLANLLAAGGATRPHARISHNCQQPEQSGWRCRDAGSIEELPMDARPSRKRSSRGHKNGQLWGAEVIRVDRVTNLSCPIRAVSAAVVRASLVRSSSDNGAADRPKELYEGYGLSFCYFQGATGAPLISPACEAGE